MTRAELLALAARVETEEPSDDLNEEVRLAFGYARVIDQCGDYNPRPYTTSLDAAASLVPRECGWWVGTVNGASRARIWMNFSYDGPNASAKTCAAALTAAALRAKATEEMVEAAAKPAALVGCSMCGIGGDLKPYAYTCTRNDCPTRVT